jgi:hypothetical protein
VQPLLVGIRKRMVLKPMAASAEKAVPCREAVFDYPLPQSVAVQLFTCRSEFGDVTVTMMDVQESGLCLPAARALSAVVSEYGTPALL